MFRKMILFLLMSIPLAGAITTATPLPVLAVMAGLILLALSVSGRGLWTIWVAQDWLCRPPSPADGPQPCVGERVTDPEYRTSAQGGANFYLSPPISSVSATLRVTF